MPLAEQTKLEGVEVEPKPLGQGHWNHLVARAMEIAAQAHAAQVDKSGRPYVGHLLRVAAKIHPDNQAGQIVALLHDIVEDQGGDAYSLEQLGTLFPPLIIAALDAISKRPGESYAQYLDRVCANHLARAVKFCDLRDNLDRRRRVTRMVTVKDPEFGDYRFRQPVDQSLRERYQRSLRALQLGPRYGQSAWARAVDWKHPRA
jgi:GTP diphosphokinase / guanosine-3',5'-bis(diphosphate) 3'-diphosphatase